MKMNYHILFLIVLIGIISVGVVGANVMNNDTSMKDEVFDGITVSVPTDSEFVKVGEHAYKDSNYGITINTFKDNASIVKYFKKSDKAKIIPVENQPPQSVAFKKGGKIGILVTNGIEGVAVSTKDKELTTKIANKIKFSNNHRSEKPAGIPFMGKPMTVENDYNLIMLLVGEVDNKVFNTAILENTLVNVTAEYNENLDQTFEGIGIDESADEAGAEEININNESDLEEIINKDGSSSNDNSVDSDSEDISDTNDDSNSDNSINDNNDNDNNDNNNYNNDNNYNNYNNDNNDNNDNTVQSSAKSNENQQPAAGSPSASSNVDKQQEKLSLSECEGIVQQQIASNPDLRIGNSYEASNSYVFEIVDDTNQPVDQITVDALTGQITS
ncbi:hypothetical protein [Methanobrevibacter sp.]